MQDVNFYLIDTALGPLTIADAESNCTLNIDPDDEGRMRELFRLHVRPFVDGWTERYRDKLRLSLAYYMRRPEILDRVLATQQDLDMPEPSNISQFFNVLWESLFPGQDWCSLDVADIRERNDVMEINLTRNP